MINVINVLPIILHGFARSLAQYANLFPGNTFSQKTKNTGKDDIMCGEYFDEN